MRAAWIIAAALAVGALAPGWARAGVYFTTGTNVPQFANPEDPDAQEPWPRYSPFKTFQSDLAGYRAAAVGGLNHDRYLRRVKEFENREASGTLSLDDRINLGAYYIRLQQFPKAIRVLEPRAQESRHFMLLANLATAYELAGGMGDRALNYRQLALASWPAMYPGWNSEQLNFYCKAEKYHLTLLQLREEAQRQGRRNRLQLDNLFPRVRFVGPGGEYEAGTIAPVQRAEIPDDAVNIVMQLLLWLPFDDPLHWLLGELLNAQGDVGGSAAMMKEVLNKTQGPDPGGPARGADPTAPGGWGNKPQQPTRWDAAAPAELREHYRIVAAEATAREKWVQYKSAQQAAGQLDPYLDLKLQAALTPRGAGLGAGDLLREAAWPALVIHAEEAARERQAQFARAAPTDTPAATATTAAPSWEPNWRQLGVGFGAGALVTLLLGMQLKQAGRPKG